MAARGTSIDALPDAVLARIFELANPTGDARQT